MRCGRPALLAVLVSLCVACGSRVRPEELPTPDAGTPCVDGGWAREVVGPAHEGTGSLSLALDGSGAVALLFAMPLEDWPRDGDWAIAVRRAGAWLVARLDPLPSFPSRAAVAFGPDGALHVAYVRPRWGPDGVEVVHAVADGAGWDSEPVDGFDLLADVDGLAVGADGAAYVLYEGAGASERALRLAAQTSGTWEPTEVPAPRQTGAALALDPDGAVWIAFLDGANDYPQSERLARVLRRAADDWVEELTISALDSSAVPTALTMQEACCTDLWVGGEGTLQLIVPGGQLLWVGRDGGGTISEEVVLAGQRSAFSPSVAVGARSLTAVAWLAIGEDIEVGDQWFVFGPRLAVRRDGAWSVETLESLEYRADRGVRVAIDPDGRERLAWIDREGEVIYAERATDCPAR